MNTILQRIIGSATIQNWNNYETSFETNRASKSALEAARKIRGENRPPAIILHGVMPRSGTVYSGELLRLHPDLYAYPNDIWEFPFLEMTGDLIDLQKKFFMAYRQNIKRIGDMDFLPLFGASLIAYLYSFVPDRKRILIKIPDVQFLNYFYLVFPYETPLLLIRDGRDVVASTMKTWPGRKFKKVCKTWAQSANLMLAFNRYYSDVSKGDDYAHYLARYEDAVQSPEVFIHCVCQKYGLDVNKYPVNGIEGIAVRGSSSIKIDGKVVWEPVPKEKKFNPIGRWQGWSSAERRIFKKIAGQTLVNAGYCDDLNW